MKLGFTIAFVLLFLSMVANSFQEENHDTAIADQNWRDEYQPEEYKPDNEEDNPEGETVRRPRGKRRRRLRKRPRVQPVEEEDRISSTDQHPEATYDKIQNEDESVTAINLPRRRPGKRRRRPYRRYQDEDGAAAKPMRRRRKGGRKKLRPKIHEEIPQTDVPPDQDIDTEVTTQFIPTTVIPTTISSFEERSTIFPKIVRISPPERKDESQDLTSTNNVKNENEGIKSTGYGSKIFDRKKLFSSSRQTLPVTSAVIRKLIQNSKGNNSESTTVEQEMRDNYEKDFTRTNHLPENNTSLPDVLRPEKLVHAESKAQKILETKDTDSEDEEPNYPKILPRPIVSNIKQKIAETTTMTDTSEKIDTTIAPEKYEDIIMSTNEKAMSDSEFEKMLENIDVAAFNVSSFDDYILDLLKSKNGKEHLAKILELRNMTITQLLEHRERGSRKFHLVEMFPQKKNNSQSPENNSTTKTAMKTNTDKVQEIQLETHPKQEHREVVKYEQKAYNKITNKGTEIETEATVNHESREPRLFDSMPEFTTLPVSTTTKENKHPTWRVIPNPKLRPVSVRGNYEEIPISNVLNRPLEHNVNDIYIVDERESSIIHHKKYGLASHDRRKPTETFGNFKKIPVGVKSAIIISGIILAVATFGFLSLLISCRVRQKRTILRAKQDLMCEHLQNDDLMTSQQSLSPVLTKHQHQQVYNPHHQHHSHPHNRHYYLWRTIRRTFRYE